MPLNDLSLRELIELSDQLQALRAAGDTLVAASIEPRFDLTPGVPASIMTDVVVPHIGPSAIGAVLENAKAGAALNTPSREVAPPEPALDPGSAPLAAEGLAGRAPIPSVAESRPDDTPEPIPPAASLPQDDPVSDVAAAEGSGGGRVMAAAEPPAAASLRPAPGTASALAATTRDTFGAKSWTEEEDIRLVAGIVALVIGKGETRRNAIRALAAELGRPFEGTYFRTNHKLKARLDTALATARAARADAEDLLGVEKKVQSTGVKVMPHTPIDLPPIAAGTTPFPIPACAEPAEPLAEPDQAGDAAVGGHSPAAVQDEPEPSAGAPVKAWLKPEHIAPDLTPASAFPSQQPLGPPPDLHGLDLDLWHHLAGHGPRFPMTIATDLDLVEALTRGEKLPMVAADLGIDALALKNRWHILTHRILDPRGNPTIDGTQRLIRVLRAIARAMKEAA
jgi:hypothetical protein